MKKKLKQLYVKFLLWFRYRGFNTEFNKNSNQSITVSICRKLISHPDSEFAIAPISYRKYIKNKSLGLFIVLYERQVSITNHFYHYDVIISQRDWDKIIYQYDLKTERIRQEYESEIHSQIKHSLHTILEKVSNN